MRESHVRLYRRSSGLSQMDIAYLIGHNSNTAISRIEGASVHADIQLGIALAIIFDLPIKTLFPGIYWKQTHLIAQRAAMLAQHSAPPGKERQRIRHQTLTELSYLINHEPKHHDTNTHA